MNGVLPTGAAILAQRSSAAIAAAGIDIEVVAETGSTNADLLDRVGGLLRPTLRIAGHQSAGRGRAGRSWLSAPGSTLMFSLAWKFAGPLPRLAGLPLAAGVALAETLAALGVPVALKWPNDLLKDGAKLAGILVETRVAPDQGIWAVIGAGINLLMPDQLEERIGRSVASAPWLAQMERSRLMAALLDSLAAVLAEFDQAGFAAFSARWNRLHAHQGQAVAILDQGRVLHEGVAAGVDAGGRLLLDTAQGRIEVVSGDVSLRPKEG
ncbi:MAG TPA: biotin--[acetyl-CoA-carboxylase] ligase [Janthinobacterium sp.]|jgi:BirA family biotin operon repressor/biotin-[acetyl-CoA-carboxylase] ligase|nr:biotin--[acetyl-CoA-carboxylase] ligase [Janthinobacterium sp.]